MPCSLAQALLGETVKPLHEEEGWAWVQLAGDGYVGYVNGNALSAAVATPTHRVAVPSTFLYPEASLKAQPATPLTLNARVAVVAESGALLAAFERALRVLRTSEAARRLRAGFRCRR